MHTFLMPIRRVFASGAKNFARGGVVSFATVLIMTVTLGIIGLLIFMSAILTHTLGAIRDKVDVNVYFVTTAPENQIQAFGERVKQLPEVQSVTYTSREDVLATFRTRHAGDQLTLQALEELGSNPLGASLAIKAKDPSQYEGIVKFLSDEPALSSGGASIVDRINYYQNKEVIDRLTGVMHMAQQAGLGFVLFFALASIIIALATIRLAIYTSRDEIGVMRLVGASNAYIRAPFIVAGMIAGALAALITLFVLYPVTWYVGSRLAVWLGDFNIFSYYLSHFGKIFGIIMGSGIVLSGIASYLAVRRYLRI
jgi:cell division transport system permease protein